MPPLVLHDLVKVPCDSVDRCSGCVMIHGSLFSSWFSFSQKQTTKSWWHDSCWGLHQKNMVSYIWRTLFTGQDKKNCSCCNLNIALGYIKISIIKSCSSRNVLGCDYRDVAGCAASNLKTRIPVPRGSDWKKKPHNFSPELDRQTDSRAQCVDLRQCPGFPYLNLLVTSKERLQQSSCIFIF